MPPLASWFGPRDEFATFLRNYPDVRQIQWKMRIATANGQPAFGAYAWDPDEQAYMAFALNVLTLRGNRISDVVAFAIKAIDAEAQRALPPLGHRGHRLGAAAEHVRALRAP